MVLGGAYDDNAFQRHVGAATARPTRRDLQNRLAADAKLRRSMVDPDREPLEGVVEVDQAEIAFREGDTFFEPGNASKSWLSEPSRSSNATQIKPNRDASTPNISTRAPVESASP